MELKEQKINNKEFKLSANIKFVLKIRSVNTCNKITSTDILLLCEMKSITGNKLVSLY